jgi:hypothetical protein
VKLDYFEDRNGTYQHRGSRKAVFVGDFIDRGPEQREVLSVVRKMIAAGTAFAVMGNHELNAIAYSTPDDSGGFYRPHSEKNQQQHATFLAQFGEGSTDYFECSNRCPYGSKLTACEWFTLVGIRRRCKNSLGVAQ